MKKIIFVALISIMLFSCTLPTQPSATSEQPTEEVSSSQALPSPTETQTEETAASAWPENMLAFYPLTEDTADQTGYQGRAIAQTGQVTPNGFDCRQRCDLTTPNLLAFTFNHFTIQAEFTVPELSPVNQPVLVGGNNYRWAIIRLMPDQSVALIYNNDQEVKCSLQYQTNVWHQAALTYDGSTLRLYLDGKEGCSVTAELQTGDNKNISLLDSSQDIPFGGVIRNLTIFNTVEVPAASVPETANLDNPTIPADRVDYWLATCPSEADLAVIDADLTLSFESDPTAGTFECTSANGSRDLTAFQRNVYTTLIVMKKLEFTQPLPWTDKQLYQWLIDTIDGMRFRSDIENSSCCDPAGIINIQTTNLVATNTNLWINPQYGVGLKDLLVLMVHEARHNEFGGHTCGSNDNTRAELGAWGVQYYLQEYLANYPKDLAFLTSTSPGLENYYQELTEADTQTILATRFCQDK